MESNIDEEVEKFKRDLHKRPPHELHKIANQMGGNNPCIVNFYSTYLNSSRTEKFSKEIVWDNAKAYYTQKFKGEIILLRVLLALAVLLLLKDFIA